MATEVRKGDRAPGAKSVGEKKYPVSIALYGRSGSGKTTFAGTLPTPILYLNIRDNGTESIADLGDDVDVVDIETSEELKELILWAHKKASKDKLIYKSIVLDTMSQLQGIIVEELCEKKTLKKGQNPGDFGTLTKQEWGQVAGDLKSVIMDVRNLGITSCFIAQERIFNAGDEEDDGLDQLEPEVGPKLMPSVKNDLNASVSIIANTFIRVRVKTIKDDKGRKRKEITKEYSLRIGPNQVYTTKIRKPKGVEVPDYIVDPTFRKLKKIMKGQE